MRRGTAGAAAVLLGAAGLCFVLATPARPADVFGRLPPPPPIGAAARGSTIAPRSAEGRKIHLPSRPPFSSGPAVADVYRWESPGRAADPILGAPAFRVTDPIACTCPFGFRFDASFVMAALHQLGVRWSWPYLSISTGTQVTFVRLFGGTDPLVDHLGRPAGIAARSYDGPAFSATGVMDLPLSSAAYALAAIPPGAGLVYVAVPLRNVGFFEPAYVLPDGRIVSALTQDELA